jgi:hypothetical protein
VLAGLDDATVLDGLEAENKDEHQTLEVLSSVPQGRTLRDDAAVLGWKSNREFDMPHPILACHGALKKPHTDYGILRVGSDVREF